MKADLRQDSDIIRGFVQVRHPPIELAAQNDFKLKILIPYNLRTPPGTNPQP